MRSDKRTDMTKLIVTFRNIVDALRNGYMFSFCILFYFFLTPPQSYYPSASFSPPILVCERLNMTSLLHTDVFVTLGHWTNKGTTSFPVRILWTVCVGTLCAYLWLRGQRVTECPWPGHQKWELSIARNANCCRDPNIHATTFLYSHTDKDDSSSVIASHWQHH